MSLNNPLKHQTHKPKKETPAQYDLLKDNFGIDYGKPDCDWDWFAWHTEYDYYVFTEGKQDKEVFEFFNEEIMDCNVPEPTVSSFFVLGAVVLTAIKRRLK
jgi:hypothetical protein